MASLIRSSIWNFAANIFIRALSLVSYPIIVRFFIKTDIAVFKSLQSVIAMLVVIIPFGSKHLYISKSQKERPLIWNIVFFLSSFVAFLLIVLYLIFHTEIDLTGKQNSFINLSLMFLPILCWLKTLLHIKLQSKIKFRKISQALMIKQFFLYGGIILFAHFHPTFTTLYIALLFSEILEIIVLYIPNGKEIFRKINYSILFPFSKTSKKFIKYVGLEQVFNVSAQHFPTIFVVWVMGKELAPEFQLPLFAIAVPASLIMMSVAKVLFPYFSQMKTKRDQIESKIIDIEYILTFFIFPALVIISLFAREIVGILFDPSWRYAVIALKLLPIAIVANIINNPLTSFALIKEKPEITLIYSISLFIGRMSGIFLGYKIASFSGAVIGYVLLDSIVRYTRLIIDLNLYKISVYKFFGNILPNILMIAVIFSAYYLLTLTSMTNKIFSTLIAFLIAIGINLIVTKFKIISYLKLFRKSLLS